MSVGARKQWAPEADLAEREINYSGLVDPTIGQFMGPGLDGRVWKVAGAMYDTVADKTTVSLRQVDPALVEAARR